MNTRFIVATRLAEANHNIISMTELDKLGIDASARRKWVDQGRLHRVGTRSFSFAGAETTWLTEVAAGVADLNGAGLVAGRTSSRLLGLDWFCDRTVELLAPRALRRRATSATVVSTGRPMSSGDIVIIQGFRTTSATRTILDSALFHFSKSETENAIDSAIRLRLVSEQRLRTQVIARHQPAINGNRILLDALVDSGGESRLERRFLALLREAGIPRPMTQKVFRQGTRFIARVDAYFPGNLVVEVAGHGTHATRWQRKLDAQRQTELTLLGNRVVTFTYEDVSGRPCWVVAQIRRALSRAA